MSTRHKTKRFGTEGHLFTRPKQKTRTLVCVCACVRACMCLFGGAWGNYFEQQQKITGKVLARTVKLLLNRLCK